MGTTLTAMQAGSTARKFVAAIEGYSHLLSDATEAQVQAAWTGTDWASNTIIPGLTVDLQMDQRLDPWAPFHPGGRLTLIIKDSIADTFGIDVHRKTAGDETLLDGSVDANDTTITVLSASTFASSGEIHVGTECIGYSGKTGTTFTGATRGKYSPFGVDGGTRFGHAHRVRDDANAVTLRPRVTEQPRIWLGRMVGLWWHRNVAGTLDTKAQAQLVFAGRIVEIRDDPETQSTIVECEHMLDFIADATLGREMWTAQLEGGIALKAGTVFRMQDNDDIYGTGTALVADNLQIVASGATAPYQINAGVYTPADLHAALNAWWAQAKIDGDLYGVYSIKVVGAGTDDARTQILWQIDDPGAGSTETGAFAFTMPGGVARFLGFLAQSTALLGDYRLIRDSQYAGSTVHVYGSSEIPLRSLIGLRDVADGPFELTEETGVFSDQRALLPAPLAVAALADHDWGICIIDDKYVVRCARDSVNGTLEYIKSAHVFAPFSKLGALLIARAFNEPATSTVRQIFCIEASFAELLKQVFYSTGTSGYNHATYDTLGFGVGLGLPGTLLGDTFEATVDALPGGNLPQVLVIDKPKKLAELFTGDLIARWAFPLWKDQIIRFGVWSTPVAGLSVATLDESTKAAPAGQTENHRTASIHTDQWQRTIVKLEFERDLGSLDDETYLSSKTFEDPGAIDDAGGAGRPLTIRMPNLFGDTTQIGSGVGLLVPSFIANMSAFSRGSTISTRSIDARYWEGYGVGDIVLVTDAFARDPDTGQRSVTTRPGTIVAHRWQPGGGVPGETRNMTSEVEVMFRPVLRVARYVPCAQVDESQTNGGYNAGTKVLTCYAHKHSESGEAADATQFPAAAKVRVIEIDPSDPTSPQSWDDTVASQTGNTITLTTGLSGWDSAKRYRVISDDYGDATATQQAAYAYQADDADGMVADARAPYDYIFGSIGTASVTANAADDQLELPPNASYGDGVGRDIGHEVALDRLIRNVIDFKSAHSTPVMHNSAMSGTGVSGTFKLVEVRPVYVTGDSLTTSIARNVSVSTWHRSSDGASATVRISLVRSLPTDDSLEDVDRGLIYSEQTFTTTSTTWSAATAANLSASVVDGDGWAYVLVECTVKAETRGVCKFQVSARSYA